MIKIIQKYMKSIVFTLVSFLIAFSMLGFGIDVFSPNRHNNNYVAKVGDREVSRVEFEKFKREIDERYRATFGEFYPQAMNMMKIDIEGQAKEGIVSKYLLQNLADKMGLVYGPRTVQNKILNMFPANAKNMNAYAAFLRKRQQSATSFENEMMNGGGVDQIGDIIRDLSWAPRFEALSMIERDQTSYDIDYIEFDPSTLAAKVSEPSDEELKKYFEEHVNDYERAPRISYNYVVYKPEEMLDIVEVLPEDLEAYYSDNEADFTNEASAKIQYIRIPYGEEEIKKTQKKEGEEAKEEKAMTDEEKKQAKKDAKEKAEGVLEAVNAGDDIVELAKKQLPADDEEALKKAGEEITVKKSDATVGSKIVSAVLNFADKGVLDVVDDGEAFYIIKVNEFKDEELRPFDEVKDEILTIVKKREAPAQVSEYAYTQFDEWQKGGKSLQDFATEKKLTLGTVKDFEKLQDNDGLSGLTAQVLDGYKSPKQVFELDNNVVLSEVVEYKDAYLPEFEEVKEDVKTKYAAEQSVQLAKNLADKAISEIGEDKIKDLEEFAAAEGVEVKQEKGMKAIALKTPFTDENLRKDLLNTTVEGAKPQKTYQIADKAYVYQVKKITKPDLDKVEEKEVDEYVRKASERNSQEMLEALLKQLKMTVDVEERFDRY